MYPRTACVLLLWFGSILSSCGPADPDTDGSDTDADADTDTDTDTDADTDADTDVFPDEEWLPVPVGCTVSDERFSDITAVVAETGTVVQLSWRAEGRGQVQFGSSELSWTTGLDQGGDPHRADLMGLGPERELHYRLIADPEGERLCSRERSIDTMALDSSAPVLDVSVGPSLDPGFDFLAFPALPTAGADEGQRVIVLDAQGEPVWSVGLDWTFFRVFFDPVRGGVVTDSQVHLNDLEGGPRLVRWGGEVENMGGVPGQHHDIALLPDGGWAGLSREARELEGEDGETYLVYADTVVEVLPGGPGAVVWNAFDTFPVEVDPADIEVFPGIDLALWTYANGMSYCAEDDSYLVMLGPSGRVVKIDRAAGEVSWVLGGADSSFHLPGGVSPVSNGHSVECLPGDRLLVFNRGWGGEECSEAVEIQLDLDRMSAEGVWSYATPDCLSIHGCGHAHRLDNGNTLIAWGVAGQLDVVTPEGVSVMRVQSPLGFGVGYPDVARALYPEG
jgi:hypothetical protein